jgi:hypothetical protein
MFGYVRLHKPTITMGEYEQYRGVYCTLCRRLGKRYGIGARMTLSYDMTFFALVRMALSRTDVRVRKKRCFLHLEISVCKHLFRQFSQKYF